MFKIVSSGQIFYFGYVHLNACLLFSLQLSHLALEQYVWLTKKISIQCGTLTIDTLKPVAIRLENGKE